MKINKEYRKRTLINIWSFFTFYISMAVYAYVGKEDFNYVEGALMIIGVALCYTPFDVLVRKEYKKKLERASKEKWSWQSVAKMKTVFYSLLPISMILCLFPLIQILRVSGGEDIPSNKSLLVPIGCILLAFIPLIGIFNYVYGGIMHKQENSRTCYLSHGEISIGSTERLTKQAPK